MRAEISRAPWIGSYLGASLPSSITCERLGPKFAFSSGRLVVRSRRTLLPSTTLSTPVFRSTVFSGIPKYAGWVTTAVTDSMLGRGTGSTRISWRRSPILKTTLPESCWPGNMKR